MTELDRLKLVLSGKLDDLLALAVKPDFSPTGETAFENAKAAVMTAFDELWDAEYEEFTCKQNQPQPQQ